MQKKIHITKKLFIVTLGSVLGSVLFLTPSNAQSIEDMCNNNFKKVCGSSEFENCIDRKQDAIWELIDPKCEGELQSMIEAINQNDVDFLAEGASFGGKVRSGPSMSDSQIGLLAEGDKIEIHLNTGIVMNGYPWFQISHYNFETGVDLFGYQWGGILCSFDNVSGISNQCPAEWSDYSNDRKNKPSGTLAQQDPIAPIHGNSDEDNTEQDIALISQCLAKENDEGRNGINCIGTVSQGCLNDENNQTTVGMQQCIAFERTAWDTLLNKEYQLLMASQNTDDKKTALRDAQRLWINFVDQFCQLSGTLNGGSFAAVSGVQCMADLTAQQVIQLRNLNVGLNER